MRVRVCAYARVLSGSQVATPTASNEWERVAQAVGRSRLRVLTIRDRNTAQHALPRCSLQRVHNDAHAWLRLALGPADAKPATPLCRPHLHTAACTLHGLTTRRATVLRSSERSSPDLPHSTLHTAPLGSTRLQSAGRGQGTTRANQCPTLHQPQMPACISLLCPTSTPRSTAQIHQPTSEVASEDRASALHKTCSPRARPAAPHAYKCCDSSHMLCRIAHERAIAPPHQNATHASHGIFPRSGLFCCTRDARPIARWAGAPSLPPRPWGHELRPVGTPA